MSMSRGETAGISEQEQQALRALAAQDALLLARLHGRELDVETLQQLRAGAFADLFALLPEEEMAQQACMVIDRGWDALDAGDEQALLDALAADYAAIYLTHQHRVPVTESVALDDDHLERQEPMMAVRAWYRRFGVAAADWRKMADDHIAPQLAFIAHLLAGESGAPRPSVADIAAFMDEHVRTWIADFATAAASRADTPFYAGLAMFTASWLHNLRRTLTLLGAPEPAPVEKKRRERQAQAAEEEPAMYVPGMGPAI